MTKSAQVFVNFVPALTLAFLQFAMTTPGSSATDSGQSRELSIAPSGLIRGWQVLGPFPNPSCKGRIEPGRQPREGLDTDYLAPLGGEVAAIIAFGTSVPYADIDGTTRTATAQTVKLTTATTVDFMGLYPVTDNKAAYAAVSIKSDKAQEAAFFLGSDDGAKVWVNGKLAWKTPPLDGRGFTAREDKFRARLKKGANSVLVKIENGMGGWQFALEAHDARSAKAIAAKDAAMEKVRAFQRQEIGTAERFGYCFPAGHFPKIVWRDVDEVRRLAGNLPLKVRWFDGDMKEVTSATKPGRYGAWIESRMRDGTPVRRGLTCFCLPPIDFFWSDGWSTAIPPQKGIADPQVWSANSGIIDKWGGIMMREAFGGMPEGAKLFAAAHETDKAASKTVSMTWPAIAHDDYHLGLKLKLLNMADKAHPLALPRKRAGAPAPILREGTLAEAGMAPDAKERIDTACRKWAGETTEPFTVLVARHGVIVTHEAFGKFADGTPVKLDFRWEVASITKAISGMLFAMFVDQGLAGIDDPVGKFVPGFPVTGSKAITFRHCFTHTTGLTGHGEWGGMSNPHLDNVILNGIAISQPGKIHIYNGMGYDLAGKAMEYISGKSCFRLFKDNLFTPLGIDGGEMGDLAYSAKLTARELGTFAQLLANRGSYGDKEFVSEKTFEALLPQPLGKFYPELNLDWGIGLVWMRDLKKGAPSNSTDPKDYLLGYRAIGHGSATACILRVDFDHDVIVAQVRRSAGTNYDENARALLTAVNESLR